MELSNISIRKIRMESLLSTGSLILYILSLLIAWSNPIKGYETSIYSSTPLIYWIFGFISISLAVYLIIYAKSKYFKILGLMTLFLNFISHLSLYIIRDYLSYFLRSDSGEHMGIIANIVKDGFIPSNLHYPIMHDLAAICIDISGMDRTHVTNILFVIMSCVFILGMILVVHYIIPKKYHLLCYMFLAVGPISAGLYLNMIMPYLIGMLIFPMFIFLILKTISSRPPFTVKYLILSGILLCIGPMIHELTGVVMYMFIVSCIIGFIIQKLLFKNSDLIDKKSNTMYNIIYVSILSAVSLFFWLSRYTIGKLVTTIQLHIMSPDEGTVYMERTATYASNIFGWDIIDLVPYVLVASGYLLYFVFVAFTFITFPYMFRFFKKHLRLFEYITFMIFTCLILLSIIYLYLNPSSMSYARITLLAPLITLISMGVVCYTILTKFRLDSTKKIGLQCLVVLLIALVIFIPHLFLYPSADIDNVDPAFAINSQTYGYDHYMDVAIPDNKLYLLGADHIYRYSMYLYGSEVIKNSKNIEYVERNEGGIKGTPPELTELDNVENSAYIFYDLPILAFRDASRYYQHIPEEYKLTFHDFNDVSWNVNRIYDNPSIVLLQNKY